jgi:hypothetical protein
MDVQIKFFFFYQAIFHATSAPVFYTILGVLGGLLVLLRLTKSLLGIVVIDELEIGVVTNKFARTSLGAGRLIALEAEAGLQADTLAPSWHFFYGPGNMPLTKSQLRWYRKAKLAWQ